MSSSNNITWEDVLALTGLSAGFYATYYIQKSRVISNPKDARKLTKKTYNKSQLAMTFGILSTMLGWPAFGKGLMILGLTTMGLNAACEPLVKPQGQ